MVTFFEPDQDYVEEERLMYEFVVKLKTMIHDLAYEGGPSWYRFTVDPQETNVVDVGEGAFLKIDHPKHEGEYKPLVVADWIALWSPENIRAMLAMVEAHMAGVSAMRELGVEIYIGKEFLDFAQKMLGFEVSLSQISDEGDVIAEARSLSNR